MDPILLAVLAAAGVLAYLKLGHTSPAPGSSTGGTNAPGGATTPGGTTPGATPGSTAPVYVPPDYTSQPAPYRQGDPLPSYVSTLPIAPSNTPQPTYVPPTPVVNPATPFLPATHDNQPTYHGQMVAGDALYPESNALVSPSGLYSLKYQGDGNLVLYRNDGTPVWGSGTDGKQPVNVVKMQDDGNFVMYLQDGTPVWNSGTPGHPGDTLVLRDDGSLALYDTGRVVWSVGLPITSGSTPPGPQPPNVGGDLPPDPDRLTLATVKAFGFQGVPTQGVMSWGPDIPTLPNAGDRIQRLQAHKATGATHVVFVIFGHYGGISAPLNADYRGDLGTFYARCVEALQVGLWPVVALGADELPFGDIPGIAANLANALANGPQGSIRRKVVYLSGFDSVVPIGNDNDGANIDAMRSMMLGIRAAIGEDCVQAFELPSGWSFWGPRQYAGAGSYSDDAGKAIDVWLQEFDAPPGIPGPAPRIVGGTWDAEHGDYAPVWDNDSQGTHYQRIWQIAARTVAYVAPSDQPFNVPVRVSGGPQDGQIVPVSSDRPNPGRYSGQGTPRGEDVWIGFEYGTYDRTHQKSAALPDSALPPCRDYLTGCGYNGAS
jgi:hypothetical protein